MKNLCDIHSYIGSHFIYQHIYLCVKCVFNTWYSCIKCTNLWMDELCTIFIINSSHVKFVMWWPRRKLIPPIFLGDRPIYNIQQNNLLKELLCHSIIWWKWWVVTSIVSSWSLALLSIRPCGLNVQAIL